MAAISIVSYSGIQDRARQAKIQQDFQLIKQAISAAQIQTGGTLKDVVSDFWIGQDCSGVTPGTDLAALPRTHPCWTRYASALDSISNAGRINVRNLVDPWGRPYWIDSNEGESVITPCSRDNIGVYFVPTNGPNITNGVQLPFVLPGCI